MTTPRVLDGVQALVLALSCLLLSGCVAVPAIGYPKPRLPDDQVAMLKGVRSSGYFTGFNSFIREDGAAEAKWTEVGGAFLGWPPELHLLPGAYAIMAYCSSGTGGVWGIPLFLGKFEAGMTYEVECFSPAPGKLGARIIKSYASPPAPEKKAKKPRK